MQQKNSFTSISSYFFIVSLTFLPIFPVFAEETGTGKEEVVSQEALSQNDVSVDSIAYTTAKAIVDGLISPEALQDNVPVHFPGVKVGISADSFFSFLDYWGEAIALWLTWNPEKELKKLANQSNERLEEITILIQKESFSQDDLSRALSNFKDHKSLIQHRIEEKKSEISENVVAGLLVNVFQEQQWLDHNVAQRLLNAKGQDSYLTIDNALDKSLQMAVVILDTYDELSQERMLSSVNKILMQQAGSFFSSLFIASGYEELVQWAENFGNDEMIPVLEQQEKNIFGTLASEVDGAYKEEEIQGSFEKWIKYVDTDHVALMAALNTMEGKEINGFEKINYDHLLVMSASALAASVKELNQTTTEEVLEIFLNSDTEDLQNIDRLVDTLKTLYEDSEADEIVGELATKLYEDLVPIWREHGDEILLLLSRLGDERTAEEIAALLSLFDIDLTDEQIERLQQCIDLGFCETGRDIYEVLAPLLEDVDQELVDTVLTDLMDGTLEDETKQALLEAFQNRDIEAIRAALEQIDSLVSPAAGILKALEAAGYDLTDEQKVLIKLLFTNLDEALNVQNLEKIADIVDDMVISEEEREAIQAWIDEYDQSRALGALLSFYDVFGIAPDLTEEQLLALQDLAEDIDNLVDVDDISKVKALAEDRILTQEEIDQIQAALAAWDETRDAEDLMVLLSIIADGVPQETLDILAAVLADMDDGFQVGEIEELLRMYQELENIPDDVKEEQRQELLQLLRNLDEDVPLEYLIMQVLERTGYDEYLDENELAAISEFFAWVDGEATVDSIIQALETGLTDEERAQILAQLQDLEESVDVDWLSVIANERGVNLSDEEKEAIQQIVDDTMDEIYDCLEQGNCTWEDVLGNDPENIAFLEQLIKEQYKESDRYNETREEAIRIAAALINEQIGGITSEEVLAWYDAHSDQLPGVLPDDQIDEIADRIEQKSEELAEEDVQAEDLIYLIADEVVENERLSNFLNENAEEIVDAVQSHSDDFVKLIEEIQEQVTITTQNPDEIDAMREAIRTALENPPSPVDTTQLVTFLETAVSDPALSEEQQKVLAGYQARLQNNIVTEEGLAVIAGEIQQYLNTLPEQTQSALTATVPELEDILTQYNVPEEGASGGGNGEKEQGREGANGAGGSGEGTINGEKKEPSAPPKGTKQEPTLQDPSGGGQQGGDNGGEAPGENPAQQPVQNPDGGQQGGDNGGQAPGENPAQQPVQNPDGGQQGGDNGGQAPGENPVQQPVQDPGGGQQGGDNGGQQGGDNGNGQENNEDQRAPGGNSTPSPTPQQNQGSPSPFGGAQFIVR